MAELPMAIPARNAATTDLVSWMNRQSASLARDAQFRGNVLRDPPYVAPANLQEMNGVWARSAGTREKAKATTTTRAG